MKDDHLNEPDPLERVLRGITNADDLRELTKHMATKAIECFTRVCSNLSSDELDQGLADGSIREKAVKLSDAEFDVVLRRWLIEHGYL
jgi:hypothetical protein